MNLAQELARIVIERGVLGALITIVSKRWETRYTADLQAAHARELALLTARADFAGSVSKAQLDAEFSALAAIWEHVHGVRSAYLDAVIPSARYFGLFTDLSTAI